MFQRAKILCSLLTSTHFQLRSHSAFLHYTHTLTHRHMHTNTVKRGFPYSYPVMLPQKTVGSKYSDWWEQTRIWIMLLIKRGCNPSLSKAGRYPQYNRAIKASTGGTCLLQQVCISGVLNLLLPRTHIWPLKGWGLDHWQQSTATQIRWYILNNVTKSTYSTTHRKV